jgi:hypothetical protein
MMRVYGSEWIPSHEELRQGTEQKADQSGGVLPEIKAIAWFASLAALCL